MLKSRNQRSHLVLRRLMKFHINAHHKSPCNPYHLVIFVKLYANERRKSRIQFLSSKSPHEVAQVASLAILEEKFSTVWEMKSIIYVNYLSIRRNAKHTISVHFYKCNLIDQVHYYRKFLNVYKVYTRPFYLALNKSFVYIMRPSCGC